MTFRPAAKESLACRQPDLVIMEYPSVETIERLAPSMNLAWPSFEAFFFVLRLFFLAAAQAKRLNESHGQKFLIFNFSEEPYERSKFDGEARRLFLCQASTNWADPPVQRF